MPVCIVCAPLSAAECCSGYTCGGTEPNELRTASPVSRHRSRATEGEAAAEPGEAAHAPICALPPSLPPSPALSLCLYLPRSASLPVFSSFVLSAPPFLVSFPRLSLRLPHLLAVSFCPAHLPLVPTALLLLFSSSHLPPHLADSHAAPGQRGTLRNGEVLSPSPFLCGSQPITEDGIHTAPARVTARRTQREPRTPGCADLSLLTRSAAQCAYSCVSQMNRLRVAISEACPLFPSVQVCLAWQLFRQHFRTRLFAPEVLALSLFLDSICFFLVLLFTSSAPARVFALRHSHSNGRRRSSERRQVIDCSYCLSACCCTMPPPLLRSHSSSRSRRRSSHSRGRREHGKFVCACFQA